MAQKKSDDLPVIKKAYDLALYLIPLIGRMPRAHKFTLGDRIADHAYELLEMLTTARYQRNKAQTLVGANLLLERLRLLLRLAKDVKAISVKAYGHSTGIADEVGAMLGGWLRSAKGGTR